MKPVIYLFLGVVVIWALFLGYTTGKQTSTAQKTSVVQWEYASIIASYSFNPTRDKTNKIAGVAVVCYMQNNGCRLSEIKHEVDYTSYIQARLLPLEENSAARTNAGIRASEIAFQKALAQLGSEGWEMIGEPDINFEFVDYEQYLKLEDRSVFFNRKNTKAVYFKRLKMS